MARRKPGVFCIEGRWSASLKDTKTVRPLLDLAGVVEKIDFLHVAVLTRESFEVAVRTWHQKQYSKYSVGYFALHGTRGRLLVGRQTVSLRELGEMLRGVCKGRVLYFGSCETLGVADEEIDEFRRTTGARAVIGYTKSIDWLESSAFDLLLLKAATDYQRPDALERAMRKNYGELCLRLGFKVRHAGSR